MVTNYDEKELNQIVGRLIYLLCNENKELNFDDYEINKKSYKQNREIFHNLFMERKPAPLNSEFIKLQNELLSYENDKKKLIDVDNFEYLKNMTIFVGDIASLKADAIVVSCEGNLLGSFDPDDKSIASYILTNGGLQIRQELNYITSRQNKIEPFGSSKIVKGYNLPSKYVILSVSPKISYGRIGYKDKENLVNCYKSSLELAKEKNLSSIVFSSLSTGSKGYPKQLASEIAVATVSNWLKVNNYPLKVIFCVNDKTNLEHYKISFVDYDII